ncbi:MAG: isoprenylcysteine carboxylmethyltransferase family protein [Ignavibacteriaceae bacterium]|jgi:protein-S-isoprenylcysteine O-methyltransferase Ste14
MNKILPPTYFYTCIVISVMLHFLLPIEKIIKLPYNWIGFLFFFLGGTLNIWTDQLFKKVNTTVKPFEKPSSLILNGPFKISRNPMYLGMALLLIGLGFVLGSITSFIGFILFVAAMEIGFIQQEEKILLGVFGAEFEAYKKKVRRWI